MKEPIQSRARDPPSWPLLLIALLVECRSLIGQGVWDALPLRGSGILLMPLLSREASGSMRVERGKGNPSVSVFGLSWMKAPGRMSWVRLLLTALKCMMWATCQISEDQKSQTLDLTVWQFGDMRKHCSSALLVYLSGWPYWSFTRKILAFSFTRMIEAAFIMGVELSVFPHSQRNGNCVLGYKNTPTVPSYWGTGWEHWPMESSKGVLETVPWNSVWALQWAGAPVTMDSSCRQIKPSGLIRNFK